MKRILNRYLFTTGAAALVVAAILTGLVQAQNQAKEKPAKPAAEEKTDKPKPAAEKREAKPKAKPEAARKEAARKPADRARPSPDRFNPHAGRGDARHPERGQGEPVTWLGIAVTPVPDAVRAHLDLPQGTGVGVGEVLPDSPAAKAGFRPHDVLTKLDDQILVTPEQFQVLVRMKKPGDKVAITYLRAGKESTATVVLATHRFPVAGARPPVSRDPLSPQARRGPGPGPGPGFDHDWNDHWRQLEREWGDKMRGWWEEHGDEIGEQFRRSFEEAMEEAREMTPRLEEWLEDAKREPGIQSRHYQHSEHRVYVKDEDHQVKITTKEGKKFATVLDNDGKELFEGFYETDEERARVPDEILKKLDRIEIKSSPRLSEREEKRHLLDRDAEERQRNLRRQIEEREHRELKERERHERSRSSRSRSEKDPI